MFTGLIEEIGTVRRIERGAKGARLTIAANTVLENTKIGDSIATNGVCLTVVDITEDTYSVTAMKETLLRSIWASCRSAISSMWSVRCGPMRCSTGHIVQGHVDQTAVCTAVDDAEAAGIYVQIRTCGG